MKRIFTADTAKDYLVKHSQKNDHNDLRLAIDMKNMDYVLNHSDDLFYYRPNPTKRNPIIFYPIPSFKHLSEYQAHTKKKLFDALVHSSLMDSKMLNAYQIAYIEAMRTPFQHFTYYDKYSEPQSLYLEGLQFKLGTVAYNLIYAFTKLNQIIPNSKFKACLKLLQPYYQSLMKQHYNKPNSIVNENTFLDENSVHLLIQTAYLLQF